MKITKTRLAGAAALAAVTGVSALAAPTSQAGKYDTPKPVTIKAVFKGGKSAPKFKGPNKVARGSKLTMLNASNPKKIGPHTFSIVKKNLLPRKKAEYEACHDLDPASACGRIAKAHKVNPKTFAVGKPDVDVGKKGWDKSFGKKGDTFYTETEGESETRKVTAKVGSKLILFCAVHPEMVKKLKVTR